eukprot:6918917-Pyramimonas_sp.AAC.1
MIRMARTLAVLLSPNAGKFSPDPSATLAESVSRFAMASSPAGFPPACAGNFATPRWRPPRSRAMV